ncbi:F-box protein At1g30200-like [Salvia miltiorrhiza]|uniref:F-box protein At1g30200-like n=1 Tax=Salvia miltiorrhiza TaxID=226208 RepID=UPI0025ACFF20|nr:F-box protein At1g30200-like [Salvia miltiorrhiza]XP_057790281.1 F-box protein At1g30200-like [Salvia miltiorrhiza]
MDSSSEAAFHSDDFFDRLPDDVVLSIFGKLQDAKSLCLSMSACKRFRSIAPQVDRIFLPIPQKKSAVKEFDQKNSFKNLVIRALMKPFHLISQMVKLKPKTEENDLDFYSYYVPNEILKNFQGIRGLHLRLPCHGNQKQSPSKNGKNSTTLLKWRAEFGRELHSCVILGAKAWAEKDADESKEDASRVMPDDELKLRIVWTISCLIAASARHYLMQETVKGLKMIENVVVSDESDQGRLCMNKEQIEEIRQSSKGKGHEMAESRSRVPALRMKMWYLDQLEVPGSAKVMEGATLVVIRPAGGGGAEDEGSRSDAEMVADAFGGEEGEGKVMGEAVRKLMVAKKCYVLEMNSF